MQDDNKLETDEGNYEVSETAVKDKSMLSSQAQKLCENIDAYWMTPVCNAPEARKSSRCSTGFLSTV